MVIESTRFGSLEVEEKDIVQISHGLPGFPEEKAFAFLPYGPDSPFAFLQSVTDPNLTFMLVEPFLFFVDYQFELDDEFAKGLGITEDTPPQIYTIVTVPEKLEEMTANLLAPIVVNWKSRQAAQIILEKTAYTTRHLLFPQGFPKQADKGAK